MSQKTTLQAHIDGLCEQLGISDKPYNDGTTIKELEKLIDELEKQIPDDDDDDDTGGADDFTDTGLDGLVEIGTVDDSELPPGAVILEDADGPEVFTNDNGDFLIKAEVSIQLLSHGQRVFIPAGEATYVEESAALAAVDEKVAVLLAK